MAATTKKKSTRTSAARTSTKKPATRARVSRKQAQTERLENRVFALTIAFTVLSLVFLWFSMLRYS